MEIFFPFSNNLYTLKAGIENLFRSMVSHKRNNFNKINADRPAPVTIYEFTAGNIDFYISFLFTFIILCHYLFISFFVYSFTYHLFLFIVPGSPAGVQGYTARGMHASAARDYHLQERTGVLHHHSQAVQACTQDCLWLNTCSAMKTKHRVF